MIVNNSLPKKVLIITYYFPPVGGGAVIRTLKFAKYLPAYGWQPIILTASVNTLIKDESLLKELNDTTRIYRTKPSLFTELKFKLLRKNYSQLSTENDTNVKKPTWSARFLNQLVRALERVKKPVESWLLIPDQHVGWVKPAFRIAEKIIKENAIDAIITSGPPHSVHLVGQRIVTKYKLPWLIDFRDDWDTNPLFIPSTGFGKKIIKHMENRVITSANILITVTPPLREKIAKRYPNLPDNKFITVWNGYDPADFKSINQLPIASKEILRIVYVGSFHHQRNTDSFFGALKQLSDQQPALFNILDITFIGQFADVKSKWVELFGNHIHFHSHLPHLQSITAMQTADALLLFLTSEEDGKIAMPGKIFEYIAAGRPIIAFICSGLAKDLIEKNNLGWTADVNQSKQIYELLVRLLNQWKLNGYLEFKSDYEFYKQFDRKNITDQLAQHLNLITNNRNAV